MSLGVFSQPAIKWITIGILLLCGLYLARTAILIGLAAWLDVGQPPIKADYVFILPGNEQTRPFVAAALIRKKYTDTALIPSNQVTAVVEEGFELPTEEKIRGSLLARGIADNKIKILESATNSTWSDAQTLATFLKSHPTSTVLVVTDHFHTRRSSWVFRQVVPSAKARLRFISAPTDGWNKDNWWTTKTGILLVTTEYMKYAFYLLRYGDYLTWLSLITVTVVLAIWRIFRWKNSPVISAD